MIINRTLWSSTGSSQASKQILLESCWILLESFTILSDLLAESSWIFTVTFTTQTNEVRSILWSIFLPDLFSWLSFGFLYSPCYWISLFISLYSFCWSVRCVQNVFITAGWVEKHGRGTSGSLQDVRVVKSQQRQSVCTKCNGECKGVYVLKLSMFSSWLCLAWCRAFLRAFLRVFLRAWPKKAMAEKYYDEVYSTVSW